MSKHFKRTCARYSPSHQDTVLAIFNLFTYTKTQTNTNTNKKNTKKKHLTNTPSAHVLDTHRPTKTQSSNRYNIQLPPPAPCTETAGLKKETQAQKTKEVELRMPRNRLYTL